MSEEEPHTHEEQLDEQLDVHDEDGNDEVRREALRQELSQTNYILDSAGPIQVQLWNYTFGTSATDTALGRDYRNEEARPRNGSRSRQIA